MNKGKQIQLNRDAILYVKECLSDGHTLAHHLLETVNLDSGSVSTFVPYDANEGLPHDFKHGPLLQQPHPESVISDQNKADSKIMMIATPNTDSLLTETISEYLNANKGRIVILEDAMARPSDPCMKTVKKTTWRAFHDEVYYFLKCPDCSHTQVGQALKDAQSTYPVLLGAMITLPHEQRFIIGQGNLTSKALKTVADYTEHIIVGAYDGEGYVIWSKQFFAC